jgi:hypothetical protein
MTFYYEGDYIFLIVDILLLEMLVVKEIICLLMLRFLELNNPIVPIEFRVY